MLNVFSYMYNYYYMHTRIYMYINAYISSTRINTRYLQIMMMMMRRIVLDDLVDDDDMLILSDTEQWRLVIVAFISYNMGFCDAEISV